MRIFLVVEELHLFMPDFIAEFLRRTPDEIVGAALVTRVPRKNCMSAYLRRHFYFLRLSELIKAAWMVGAAAIKNRLIRSRSPHGPFFSVRAVMQALGVPFFEIGPSINQPEALARIRATAPDVIISSNPLIFREELLALPRICCINRHAALLPANGGLWPIFHALRKGERHTGVTIHTMERAIDHGIPLVQKEVPIHSGDTINTLYTKTFLLSADALLEALDKVRHDDFTPHIIRNGSPSYNSFPTPQHWREFRNRGGRFI